jgi:hypothetical protein
LLEEATRTRNGNRWPAPGGQVVRSKGKLVFATQALPKVLRCSI